jgi:ABC-2 type transport system permease protein
MGVFFTFINLQPQNGDFQNTLNQLTIFLLILVPVLTMRLFAEEARQKTDQLLFTSPVSITSIVLGKYLSAFLLACIGMAITVVYPLMISHFGKLPVPQIATLYLGFVLLIACFISIGMFISVNTENQIVAAVITALIIVFMFIMDAVVSFINDTVTNAQAGSASAISIGFVVLVIVLLAYIVYDSTKNIYMGGIVALLLIAAATGLFFFNPNFFDGMIVKVTQWLSLMSRFDNFNNGILNVSDIIYYISFMAAFVYLSINTLEKRRWR